MRFRLYMDFDGDGFICRNVGESDPLNLIPTPVSLLGVYHYATSSNVTLTRRFERTPYGVNVLRLDTGGEAYGGAVFGQSESTGIMQMACLPSTTYTAQCWIKLVNAYGADDGIEFVMHDQAYTWLGGMWLNANSNWQRFSFTFTTGAGSDHFRFVLRKNGISSDRVVFDIAGMMVIQAATPADYFNAGSPTNWRDDVTSYVMATISTNDGLPPGDNFALASRLVTALDNQTGIFDPDNAFGALYGFHHRGMLIDLDAIDGANQATIWRGTLESITLTGEYAQVAQIVAGDALLLMTNTDFSPPFLEDVDTGTAIRALFDSGALNYPTPAAFGLLDAEGYSELDTAIGIFENQITDFETGDTVLEFAGDNIDRGQGVNAQNYIRELLASEAGGRFFYDARRGVYVFHRRNRDAADILDVYAPPYVMELPAPLVTWGDDIVNSVEVHYETREIGAPGTVVFEAENLPISISGDDTRTITARFTTSDPNARVAAKDGILPVKGLDYSVTDDKGNDKSGDVMVMVKFDASSAEITIKNYSQKTRLVTLLRLRATPIITRQPESVKSVDATSIARHGLRRKTISAEAIGRQEFAQQYADYLAHRDSTPVLQAKRISITPESDAEAARTVQNAGVGDLLRLDAPNVPAGDYVILGRNFQIPVDAYQPIATYTIQLRGRTDLIILDDPDRGLLDVGVLGL